MLDTLNAILLAAEQGVRYADYEICLKVFLILMVVPAVAIIVVIMMQKGTNDNVGVITGASDTYYGKNKSTNKESILKKITFGLFAFIMICSIICFVMWGLISQGA
ncbi:MAG TPA: preprotein translocase subunit SecG [Clostridiales bacterium]|nr:preprotein translocase subunit SecG [Clostridiales bacterium]